MGWRVQGVRKGEGVPSRDFATHGCSGRSFGAEEEKVGCGVDPNRRAAFAYPGVGRGVASEEKRPFDDLEPR